MRLLVRYGDGSIEVAILMAVFNGCLRVFVPACDDAIEFRWEGGQWHDEDGDPLKIDFEPGEDEFIRSAQAALGESADGLITPALGSWRLDSIVGFPVSVN